MLQTLNTRNRGGFTLVEIMIVVAIIALLATIAVPNFLRARKRSQATVVMNEARMINAAIDQYAIEQNKKDTDAVTWTAIHGYIKENSALYGAAGKDSQKNAFVFTTVGAGAPVPEATKTLLSDVVESSFWSPF